MDVATLRLEVLRLTYRKDQSPEENTRTADALIEWIQKDDGPTTKSPGKKRPAAEDKDAGDRRPL